MADVIRGQCMVFFNTVWKTLGAACLVRGQVSHYFHWLSSGHGVPKRFVPPEPPTSPSLFRQRCKPPKLPPDAAIQR